MRSPQTDLLLSRIWRPRGTSGRCFAHHRVSPCDKCATLEELADRVETEERVKVTMLALSRFMVFVWMEAYAQRWAAKCSGNKEHQLDITDWRDHAFWLAWGRGRLKISW